MIIDAGASDVVYTASISGVHANFLGASLQAAGITKESFGTLANGHDSGALHFYGSIQSQFLFALLVLFANRYLADLGVPGGTPAFSRTQPDRDHADYLRRRKRLRDDVRGRDTG